MAKHKKQVHLYIIGVDSAKLAIGNEARIHEVTKSYAVIPKKRIA
jgi:phage terminase large subunit GpA-like protein